ncbi:P-loop containing nucleoside triphosphate hydrolase domain-containing protein [Strongyloides ratti]|uniref:P-loop containing Nucleoside triphosphate hydrolase domain-containing protein n=1 Tax=Strongyloides ratti TaxID=34506 RepID=A0A090LGR9_STRRB|nr:P-loop containing nucleoside triphosphate hydrolase domain-containing protein [Strongyloides ratti]CEF68977.1 P-loop containing nucleoside triphosphate hydrolase domain-containing protein [Strongyloides ratti]
MTDNAELIKRLRIGFDNYHNSDSPCSQNSPHTTILSNEPINILQKNETPINVSSRILERNKDVDETNSSCNNEDILRDEKKKKRKEKSSRKDSKSHKFLTNVKILSKETTTLSPSTPKQNMCIRNIVSRRKILKHSTVLINDALDFNIQIKDFLNDVSSDYHVVSFIGSQGSGKSTIANLLSGLCTSDIQKKCIFKLSHYDVGLTRPNAPRVEIYVTKSDLIILDFKGLVSEKYFHCIAKRGKDYIGKDGETTDEEWLKTEQLKLISYAISISHTIIVTTTNFDETNEFVEQLKLGNRIHLGLFETMKTNNTSRFNTLSLGRRVNVLFFYSNKLGKNENEIREKFTLKQKILDVGLEMSNLNLEAYFQIYDKRVGDYDRKLLFVVPKIITTDVGYKFKETDTKNTSDPTKPSSLLIDRRTTRKLNFITGESNFLYEDQENYHTVPVKEYDYTHFLSHILKTSSINSETFDENFFANIGFDDTNSNMEKWHNIMKQTPVNSDDAFKNYIKKHKLSNIVGEKKIWFDDDNDYNLKKDDSLVNHNKDVDALITYIRVGLRRLDKSLFFDKKNLSPKEWLMLCQNVWKNLTNIQLKTEKNNCNC